MKKTEKAFHNWRPGGIHLTFPNGNWLSTTWARWSYSDNHDVDPFVEDELSNGKFINLQSNTCEIMIECPQSVRDEVSEIVGNDMSENSVSGYLSMDTWLKVVAVMSK